MHGTRLRPVYSRWGRKHIPLQVGGGGGGRSQSTSHTHVLVCICSNVRQFFSLGQSLLI